MGVVLAGCATTSGGPQTEVEKAVGKCLATVAATTLLGVGIDLIAGGGGGDGAKIGAGVGAGACAVLLIVANEKDKENIRKQQALVAELKEAQSTEYVNEKGQTVQLTTRVVEEKVSEEITTAVYEYAEANNSLSNIEPSTPNIAIPVAVESRICRKVATDISVDGKSTSINELVCRTSEGNWVPRPAPDGIEV